jgi:hypothetical protein
MMISKIFQYLSIGCACILFSGCFDGGSKISMIQNGTLNFDDTKTIQDVLQSSPILSGQKWRYFKAEDGSQVVEFTAELNSKLLISSLKELKNIIESNPMEAMALSGGSPEKMLGLGMLLKSDTQFSKCNYTVQFLLSKAKKDSFKVGPTELGVTATMNFVNGTKTVTKEINDEDDVILKTIYENKPAGIALWIASQLLAENTVEQINQSINK